MADVDLDALEARLRNHVCGRCDNGMTTAPCRGCEAVARQANERARRGISSTVGIGHRGACTATPITCRMCEGTGKRLPMDGETMLALIARVREAERKTDVADAYAIKVREQRDAARAEIAVMAETLAHAAHARGAVEEYPDGTDELSLALERAERAERERDEARAACASMRAAIVDLVSTDGECRCAPGVSLDCPTCRAAHLTLPQSDAGAPLLAELRDLRAEAETLRATLRAAANRARGIVQSPEADERALAVLGELPCEVERLRRERVVLALDDAEAPGG